MNEISLKFVPICPIDSSNPELVQVMAWCRPGDKPLFETMMTYFTGANMRQSASVKCNHTDMGPLLPADIR